jgi:hypothetical protein
MKFNSIKYGALAGILCGAMMTTAFYAGVSTRNNRYLTLGFIILTFASSFVTIYKEKKDKDGEIDFKRSLKIGISAALLCAIIFSGFTFFYYTVMNPNYATKYLVDIELSLKQAGKAGAALQNEMNLWREDMSPLNQTAKTLFGISVISSIFAAINALILCKKD